MALLKISSSHGLEAFPSRLTPRDFTPNNTPYVGKKVEKQRALSVFVIRGSRVRFLQPAPLNQRLSGRPKRRGESSAKLAIR
jgi:hypothetical protein